MNNKTFRTFILFFMVALAPFLYQSSAQAAPGDYLFQWGTPSIFNIPLGVAVDGSGDIYVADTNNSQIQVFDNTRTYQGTIGEGFGSGNGQLSFPVGVAVDTSGNVYVADTGNNRVAVFDSTWTYQRSIGAGQGTGDGQFSAVGGVAVDGTGNVFVLDVGYDSPFTIRGRVEKFDSSGSYVTQWISPGEEFNSTNGLAVDGSGNVYVADGAVNAVYVFDNAGNYLRQLGGLAASNPFGLAVDVSGNVYLVDRTVGGQIEVCDSTGTFQRNIGGGYGPGNGQFNNPVGVAVDGSGNVYVADSNNQRIEIFDSTGIFVGKLGGATDNGQFNNPGSAAGDASGNVYVVDDINDRVQKFDSSGAYLTQWGSPGAGNGQFGFSIRSAIAVDGSGNVFVADDANRIQKFSSSGTFILQWGSYGSGHGQFDRIYGVAVDGSGNVYVADVYTYDNSNRIQKFDNSGNYLAQWSSSFNEPQGLAADANGNVYVLSGSVQKFDSSGNILTQWGDGQFGTALGIAVDGGGNVYVADTSNNRIEVFDNAGSFLGQWGGVGTGNGQFQGPKAVATNRYGTVAYVVDTFNNRVQAFTGYGNLPFTAPTPTGSNVTVTPAGSGTTITFSTVSASGTTTVAVSSIGPSAPFGFSLGNPASYYNMTTTAIFSGAVNVCISYNPASFASGSDVRLLHYNGSSWDDVTTSVDTQNNIVCGTSSSLSPFTVMARKGALQEANDLIALVNSMNLSSSVTKSLLSYLNDASSQLSKKKPNVVGACSDLSNFISLVNAQTGKKISSAQASQLIAAASQIKTVLKCK